MDVEPVVGPDLLDGLGLPFLQSLRLPEGLATRIDPNKIASMTCLPSTPRQGNHFNGLTLQT